MSKVSKETASNASKDIPQLGFILSFVFAIVGASLFLGWENFGTETTMKVWGMLLVLFSICAFGSEVSTKIKNEGALELAIGLSMSLSILMLRNTFEGFPNIASLLIGAFSILFIMISFFRFVPKLNSNQLFVGSSLGEGTKFFYKWLLVIGNICGAVVSMYNLYEIVF